MNTQTMTVEHGNARFTVISSSCIRIEYHKDHNFIDQPSWFAINRDIDGSKHDVKQTGCNLEICTEYIKLIHVDDGAPFSSANLRASIKYGHNSVKWRFGWKNRQNLGGTLQTLDGISCPEDLPEGLLSRDGWYLLDDSSSPLFTDDWISMRPSDAGFDGYLFGYGNDFQRALRDLTTISGKIPMPRKYVLGSWYSRWHNYTDDDYRQIVSEYDEHDIPLDIIVMDMDWHVKPEKAPGFGWANMPGWTGWTWNRELIKNPQKLLDWFHEQKLHVTLNVHPHDGVRTHEDVYPEFMRLLGKDPASEENIPFSCGNKEYMDAYFQATHKPLEKQGVDFWWVDWQQDSIIPLALGLENMRHLPLLNYCYYKNSISEEKRGLGFSRWAGWGDHRYPIHFSGDATCNWDMLAFEVYFTSTAGNVGCFFWSHDIGGFHGERNPEQFARWVQFGITTAAVRLHSTGDELDRRPWKWGKEIEESIRKSLHLRSRLIPYIYSEMRKCYDYARPLNRPMYFDFPEETLCYNLPEQYFFGDSFLVAPVTVPMEDVNGNVAVNVWIPNGEWYNWFTGEKYQNGQTVVCSGINEFPLIVKGGMPIPMQDYNSRMTSVDNSRLIIKCFYIKGTGSYRFYEDDGISNGYQGDEYCETMMTFCGDDSEFRFEIAAAKGSYDKQSEERSYEIHIQALPDKIRTVSCDDCKVEVNFINNELQIKTETVSIRKSLSVVGQVSD